jgi:hypothetical protein
MTKLWPYTQCYLIYYVGSTETKDLKLRLWQPERQLSPESGANCENLEVRFQT